MKKSNKEIIKKVIEKELSTPYKVNKEYFEFVKSTFIENWPVELTNISIGQTGIKLSFNEMKTLGTYLNGEFHDAGPEYYPDIKDQVKKITCDIIEKIEKNTYIFRNGFFVRLGSRSPKDTMEFYSHENGHCYTYEDALRLLTYSSERIYIDLQDCIQSNYQTYIWLREWMVFEPWQEFRCFMYKRKLIGVSQYNAIQGEVFSEIKENKDSIIYAIEKFFELFKKASHLDSVIFDIIYFKKESIINGYKTIANSIKLLEINPFFSMTYPGLYSWDEFNQNKKFKELFIYNKLKAK